MATPQALYSEEVIQDLCLMQEFKILPNGQTLLDLWPEQKRFLLMARAVHGDLSQIYQKEAARIRLEVVDSAEPIDLMPEGMAVDMARLGLNPFVEADERKRREVERLRQKVRE
jgi:hypothetical protein